MTKYRVRDIPRQIEPGGMEFETVWVVEKRVFPLVWVRAKMNGNHVSFSNAILADKFKSQLESKNKRKHRYNHYIHSMFCKKCRVLMIDYKTCVGAPPYVSGRKMNGEDYLELECRKCGYKWHVLKKQV